MANIQSEMQAAESMENVKVVKDVQKARKTQDGKIMSALLNKSLKAEQPEGKMMSRLLGKTETTPLRESSLIGSL